MHRTTIMLPEELKLKARQRAQSNGISLGELIRHAVERYLATEDRLGGEDPFYSDTAVFHDPAGPTDIAARHDDYLAEIYEEKLNRGKP